MKINFLDTNGKPILPTHDQTFIVRTLPEEPTANISLVVLIPQIKLKNFGEYSINLTIDDCPVGSTLFYVRKVAWIGCFSFLFSNPYKILQFK